MLDRHSLKPNKDVGLGLFLLVVGLVLGALLPPIGGLVYPDDTSAEAGFLRDMDIHHAQAVEMSFMIRSKENISQDIRVLAFDIINTQSVQQGMMRGWLEQWGLTQTSTRPLMEWMKDYEHSPELVERIEFITGKEVHAHHGEHMANHPDVSIAVLMPGMATDDQMVALGNAQGEEAEELYLELMMYHHIGGVDMARAIIDLSEREDVVRLATTMETGQQEEIDLIREWLKQY